MELRIKIPQITSQWVVEAIGYSGDADDTNRAVVYQGPSREIAQRTYLEALVLARANLTNISRTLGPCYDADPEDSIGTARFFWARKCWSRDKFTEDAEASLTGAEIFWIDENGGKLPLHAELDPDEKELLALVPSLRVPKRGFDISALFAAFERIEISAATGQANPGKAMISL